VIVPVVPDEAAAPDACVVVAEAAPDDPPDSMFTFSVLHPASADAPRAPISAMAEMRFITCIHFPPSHVYKKYLFNSFSSDRSGFP
jgi:hypothetical protein